MRSLASVVVPAQKRAARRSCIPGPGVALDPQFIACPTILHPAFWPVGQALRPSRPTDTLRVLIYGEGQPVSTSGLITILFTDLVGSTAHASSVGDPAADEMRRDHFASLREAVVASGGTEVKTIGDALMVSYSGAADALGGAATMQRAVERHNRRLSGQPIAMRVGISAGDASFEDGDWFGTPVVEAARLCAKADGGQILVSDLVRALAGSRTDLEVRSLGALDLKGLPEPVAACEVVWQITDPITATPLPSFVDTNPAFPFSGRMDHLETLTTAWKETAEGARRAVLVSGEPGIGKTRLVTEAVRAAHDRGSIVLWGRCDEDLSVPYGPFAEALRHYVAVKAARPAPRRTGRARWRAGPHRAGHHEQGAWSRRADGGRRRDRAVPSVRRGR